MCSEDSRGLCSIRASLARGRGSGSMGGVDAGGLIRSPYGAGNPGDRTAASLGSTEERSALSLLGDSRLRAGHRVQHRNQGRDLGLW